MLLIWCESREQSGAAVCPGIAEEDVAGDQELSKGVWLAGENNLDEL